MELEVFKKPNESSVDLIMTVLTKFPGFLKKMEILTTYHQTLMTVI